MELWQVLLNMIELLYSNKASLYNAFCFVIIEDNMITKLILQQ